MREIKFRAWDKLSNRWIKYEFGTPPVIDFGGYLRKTHANLSYTELGGTWNGDSSSYVLMQYTGLKDKNGVEIYEGDVLGYFWLDDMNKYYDQVPVIFDDGQFCIYINGLAFHKPLELRHYVSRSKVIGNIYENPELLEANQ